jgi:hypothetical protein
MAISLYPRYEPEGKYEVTKTILRAGRFWYYVKVVILVNIIIYTYLTLFSKIIVIKPPAENYVISEIYRTIKNLKDRPTTTPVIDFVAEEKSLAATSSSDLTQRLRGRFLLQVERAGEAWYLNLDDLKKYYLGEPENGLKVLRRLSNVVIDRSISGSFPFTADQLGKIITSPKAMGKIYYVSPKDRRAYILEKPADLTNVINVFGIGITNTNLRKIEIGEIEE